MGYVSAAEALAGTAMLPLWNEATEQTRELVRCSFRDWLAVALAGAAEPDVGAVASTVATVAGDEVSAATPVGGGRRVSAREAAFLDGFAGHVLDYDDTSTGPLEGHPSAAVIPPLLAVGEMQRLTLGDLFSAYTRGVQVADQLGSWVSPHHYAMGWHATATIGSIAGAAAAATLLELPADGVVHAVSLAATQAAGLRASFGTLAKPLQVGRACSVAVDAAMLAAVGVTGPADVLEVHPSFPGLAEAVAGARSPTHPLHEGLAVEDTLIKWHAACHSTHPALEALRRAAVPLPDIESVVVGVRPDILGVCGIEQPSTPLELKFSIRGVVAMALAGIDTADPAAYATSTLASGSWAAAIHKVAVQAEDLSSEWETTVVVSGRRDVRRSVMVDLRATPTLSETRSRVEEKFDRLVPGAIGRPAADRLWQLLEQRDDLPVRDLMTVVGAKP